jgi:N6-adenosine-specific RNA methylase IME4
MLELFAREMRPGWVSVGDEVLKFQQKHYFSLLKDSHKPEDVSDPALSTMPVSIL